MRRIGIALAVSVPGVSGAQLPSGDPVFHAGTRLVEVELVVRDKNGPVTGLTRDGFRLFDKGKAQEIAVFSAGTGPRNDNVGNGTGATLRPPVMSDPAAISNRLKAPGATVLLLDLLNTRFDNYGYLRANVMKFIQSASN